VIRLHALETTPTSGSPIKKIVICKGIRRTASVVRIPVVFVSRRRIYGGVGIRTWQYHRKRWRPFDLSLLFRNLVDPTSAFGILIVVAFVFVGVWMRL